ncbi:MAG: BACON domain-containing protein, partial [Planctomycetaceae bacterium]|nr:BACON domain-containing protein [Planctomycetaceae bacterium]
MKTQGVVRADKAFAVDCFRSPFFIIPIAANADRLGSQGTIAVTANPSANWTAESLVPWITINGTDRGTGNSTVSYTVDRNASNEAREGDIRITQDEVPKQWTVETIDSAGDVGSYNSLGFDPSGNPAISYGGNTGLKYASFDGQDWTTQTIDSVGDVGYYTSLSVDPSGNPAISY